MSHQDPAAPALFVMAEPPHGLSAIEKSVKSSLDAIAAGPGIPPSKMFLAQTAMELARSIDKGNGKGRAVANESAQLVATLEILDPPQIETASKDSWPAGLRKFMEAFGTNPALSRPGAPEVRDSEEP